jgi:hypothetical protein
MNVQRVNYSKFVDFIALSKGSEYVLNTTPNCPAPLNRIPTLLSPQAYHTVSPSSDLIFPGSFCNYPPVSGGIILPNSKNACPGIKNINFNETVNTTNLNDIDIQNRLADCEMNNSNNHLYKNKYNSPPMFVQEESKIFTNLDSNEYYNNSGNPLSNAPCALDDIYRLSNAPCALDDIYRLSNAPCALDDIYRLSENNVKEHIYKTNGMQFSHTSKDSDANMANSINTNKSGKGQNFDLSEINKILEKEIKNSKTPRGFVLPFDLRERENPKYRAHDNHRESKSSNIRLSSQSMNEAHDSNSKRYFKKNEAINEGEPANNSKITGTVMFDYPRKKKCEQRASDKSFVEFIEVEVSDGSQEWDESYKQKSGGNNFISDEKENENLTGHAMRSIAEQNLSDSGQPNQSFAEHPEVVYGNSRVVEADKHVLKGKIVYDYPRKNSRAVPESRVLIDEFSLSEPEPESEQDDTFHNSDGKFKERKMKYEYENNELELESELELYQHKKKKKDQEMNEHDVENIATEFWEPSNTRLNFIEMINFVPFEKKILELTESKSRDKAKAQEKCGTKRVSWRQDNELRVFDKSEQQSILEEKKSDSVNKPRSVTFINHMNGYGENFSCGYLLYQNHVDLDKHTNYVLTMDGKKITSQNLEQVGDFIHLKVIFYSFVGKKKSQKIIYHSLTEYELWGFKNKEKHYIYSIDKTETSESDNEAREVFKTKIIYNMEKDVSSEVVFYISDNRLHVNIRFNESYSKWFATNYCNIQINNYKQF